jgi:hypothetical protein
MRHIVESGTPPQVRHKRSAEFSAAEVAVVREAWAAPLAFAAALAADEHFWSVVDELRVDAEADVLARSYARRHVPGRAAIGELIGIAAEAPNREQGRAHMLMHAGVVAVFVSGAPPDGAPVRALRADHQRRVERGVRVLVARGAGRCVSCDTRLTETRTLAPRVAAGDPVRRVWRDYCAACERHAHAVADTKAAKAVLDALAAQMATGPNRERARRMGRNRPRVPIIHATSS